MVGVQGIGGVQEPKPDRPSNVRDRASENAKTSAKDDLVISNEAQAAASVARLVQLASANAEEVRAERVAAAKEAIERGDYKNPDIVAQVAERIDKYL